MSLRQAEKDRDSYCIDTKNYQDERTFCIVLLCRIHALIAPLSVLSGQSPFFFEALTGQGVEVLKFRACKAWPKHIAHK
jgi:hypothetical protein